MSNTDDFLSFYDNAEDTGNETVQETVEDVPESSSEETSSEEEDPAEETKEKDAITEKVEDDLPSESKGLLAKAQDEKRKRQDLEKQLDDMKAQIEKLSQSKQQEAKEPQIEEPDTLDEGYTPYVKNLITSEVVKVKTELSRELAIDKWGEEFIEAEKFFMSNANENDLAEALKSSNPAKFVFDIVKKHKEQQKIQDPNYVKNLEAELRAKILKEMETEQPKLSSKSILGKGGATIKQSTETIDPLDFYDKQSIFN
jgi:hypothetical protein